MRMRDVMVGAGTVVLTLMSRTTFGFLGGLVSGHVATKALRPCTTVVDVLHAELLHEYEAVPQADMQTDTRA